MPKPNVLAEARKRKGDAAALVGDLDAARQLFESACKSAPLDAEAWVKLSLIHKRRGDVSAAENCARRAVGLQPRLGYTHFALGMSLHAKGCLTDAIAAYRSAVSLQPNFADAHYWLGNASYDTGAVEPAIASLRHAISLRPNFPEALADLGAVHLSLNEVGEAESLLNRALSLQPDNLVALSNLSQLLRLQGRMEEALNTLRHALMLAPNSMQVIAGLAGLLEKSGALEEAKNLVKRGLALAIDDIQINLVAARLARREGAIQEAAVRLESMLRHTLPSDIDGECRLLLGQIYDRMDLPDRALPHIVEGKRLKASLVLRAHNDRHRYLDRIADMRKLADDALARSEPVRAMPGRRSPAFMIGFPRSGTTLLEQILDSHPAIQTMEECGAVEQVAIEFSTMNSGQHNALAALAPGEIQELQDRYFKEIEQRIDVKDSQLLVDKLPLNTVYVPLIWRIFPDAKFIFSIRHPCDVCLSCLMQDFAVNEAMSSFFTLEDTVRTYAAVMTAWLGYEKLLPLRVHRVGYEDLISDVAGTAAKVLEFLEVGWDPAVLAHTGHARMRGPINTPSYHQVTQPIYQHAKFRWRRYEEAFEPFMDTLGPFIKHFGY